MNKVVRVFGSLVIRAPLTIIVVVLAATGVMGYFNGQQQQVTGNAGFSPDNAELALERSGKLFGGTETVMQVIVEADEGVFSPAALTAVQIVEEALREQLGDHLSTQPGREAVITWLEPVHRQAEHRASTPSRSTPRGSESSIGSPTANSRRSSADSSIRW